MSIEVEAFVATALTLELMALDLARRNVEEETALRALIEAAAGDVRVMRRAHRHSEFALSEQWPAGPTLIRAFDYLSAGRRRLEIMGSEEREALLHQSPIPIEESSEPIEKIYGLVEEASIDSFPASDPPPFWSR